MNHLIALIKNPTTKPLDRQKLMEYVTKWKECKVLLGCALFHDILKPTAILCKSFQADEISVVSAIEAILRTSASMKKLKSTEMKDFPSVKKVLLRVKDDLPQPTSSGSQGVEVVGLDQSLAFLKSKYIAYIVYWLACMNVLRMALLILPHSCLEGSSHPWMAED